MNVLILLAIVVGILVLAAFSLLGASGQSSWLQFYARGKQSGFTLSELNYLKGVVMDLKMEDPIALFWSDRSLDRAIRLISQKKREEGLEKSPETLAFMSKLYDFRKRLEFEHPRYKTGIKSTMAIIPGTRFRVLVEHLGVFNATLLQNNKQALTISVPSGRKAPDNFAWKGQRVSIYFWRAEDAGYVFDSFVMEEALDGKVAVLHLGHTDTLFRTQKRRSVRAKSKIPSFLYILKRIEGAYEKPERAPGMKCVVEDLSEDGAAIFIGGKAKPDMLIKVQFHIGEVQVVMSGTAKGVEYNAEKNQSLIHMQAVQPSHRMKNLILSYVYNVFSDDTDEQPEALP